MSWQRLVLISVLASSGWVVAWSLSETLELVHPGATPLVRWFVDGCALGAVLTVALAGRVFARRDPAAVVVAAAAAGLAGAGTAALHGTRWGFSGLYSDAGFRTEAVTRFTDSGALADYAYRGLPTYYPPALPWLEGRTAHLLGVPGWVVMKPAELLVCALVPVLSWLVWRLLLAEVPAAVVAAATSVAVALPTKPDEWLVLTLAVPWWLLVVRGLGSRPWSSRSTLAAGVGLGALLLCHTYFFVPLALATVVGVGMDLATRRPPPLSPRRGLTIAATALVVAGPSWVPGVVTRVRGLPADNLQLRWSPTGFTVPPLPGWGDPVALLGLLGLVWILTGPRRLASSVAIAWATSLAFVILGQLAQAWGLALLPEKSTELCAALMVVSGSLLVVDQVAARGTARMGLPLALGAIALSLVAAEIGVHENVQPPARVAQHMRYPDGTFPAAGPAPADSHGHPWGVSPQGMGPSVDQVNETWLALRGRPLQRGDVLVSARADVLATTAAHPFMTWKSIYSHPNGQFDRRLDLLRTVAQCTTSRCAWMLLRHNEFDAVDGLVLNHSGKDLALTVTTDSFPDAWKSDTLRFDPDLVAAPYFHARTVDGVVVAVLADPRTATGPQAKPATVLRLTL
jgi:galactan 5-O-arabinofuranosyltransferase